MTTGAVVGLGPCRSSVLHPGGGRRLCGLSPPLSLFDSLESSEVQVSIDVLFLGTDPWHILGSLADRAKRVAEVRAVLADCDPWQIARAGLLVYLASTLSTDKGVAPAHVSGARRDCSRALGA